LLNVVYGFFILPESLAPEKRREVDLKRANPLGSLKLIRKYPIVAGLMVSFFLVYMASQAVQTTWTYFTMFKFEWDEAMVGYSLGVVGVIVAIVQGGLVKYAVRLWGEKKTIYIGYVFWIVGLILFASATQGWMLFAFLLPYCLGGIASPTLQGVVSNQVADNEQGELQGAMTALISLSSIIGPLVMTNLFYQFTQDDAPFQFAGAPFAVGAVLVLVSLLLSRKSLNSMG
jgi:DHA1 family tetracycline resistance protein-like MFS transporter